MLSIMLQRHRPALCCVAPTLLVTSPSSGWTSHSTCVGWKHESKSRGIATTSSSPACRKSHLDPVTRAGLQAQLLHADWLQVLLRHCLGATVVLNRLDIGTSRPGQGCRCSRVSALCCHEISRRSRKQTEVYAETCDEVVSECSISLDGSWLRLTENSRNLEPSFKYVQTARCEVLLHSAVA